MRSLALIVLCATSTAMADGFDIGAVVSNGRIETWAADHISETYLNPERVFEGELDLIAGSVVGDEPGFFFQNGSVFGNAFIGFNIRAALRAWDALAPSNAPNTNFLSIPASTLTFGDVVLGTVTTPMADPPSPITGLQVLIPAGGVDFHFPMTLNSPLEGIYLVELELRTSLAGVQNSLPFWMVLNYGLGEPEHERAVDYVKEYIVPSPGTAAVLSLSVFALRRRRA